MLARAAICCTLLLLAACAAALPGYTPPPFKESKVVTPMKSGDVSPDGVYHMSEQEKGTDCRHLKGSMMVTITRLRHKSTEVGTSTLAAGTNKAVAPILGGSAKGLDRDAEHARDRARLAAYNRHLASKGCATIDIEAELARPPEPAGKN
jgi:hypothetical protein